MATSRATLIEVDDEELDMRWESYLNGKRDDIRRQSADHVLHLISHTAEERDENDPTMDKYSHKDEREDSIMEPSKGQQEAVDMFKVFEMFQLLEKTNWSGLTRHVKKCPQSAFVRMTQGANGYSLSSKGNLLLHEVCRFDPSLELVNTLIHVNNSALKATGEHGRLPLHFACACGASSEVVQRLIIAFPAAAKLRDGGDLMLPLHLACRWGSSKGVLKALMAVHPEGRRTRDIYAKTPMDYAKALASHDLRETAIACLQSTSRKVTFQDRATLFKNNATIADLQQENQQLVTQNVIVKNVQETQQARMKALADEFSTLQSLQADSNQKKAILEKKLEVLVKANQVKQELIERLEHENNVKYNIELKRAMKGQEEKYRELLTAERERVAELERRAKEIEITHRMYTNAILEEHDREAAEFEAFTLQFKELETHLRGNLASAEERNEFLETEVTEKSRKFKELITAEREKVAFLENHVTKVNELLESEQKRFQELEEILKQTIAVENEQREEMAADFSKKEEHYKNMLKTERNKVATLQDDYEEVRRLLKVELEKMTTFYAREDELKHLVELQQRKLRQLQDTEKLLEAEKQKCINLQESESKTRAELVAEQEKVKALESKLREVQKELEVERATIERLRSLLEEKQTEYEAEKKKVKALQKAQASKRQVLESLQQKVSILEEALAESKSIADQENEKLEAVMRELEDVKYLLNKEREVVEELNVAKKQLADLLDREKQKVRNLEQAQVVTEAEMQNSENEVDQDSLAKLVDTQKLLNMERTRVANLKEEQAQLDSILEAKCTKLESLEARLIKKEEELKSERQRFEALEKQQAETEDILQSEQRRAGNLEREHQDLLQRLAEEEEQVRALELALIETKSHVDSVEVKLNSLGQVRKEVEESFTDVEKEKIEELEKILANYKVQLDAEQDLVQELELELSEARSLCNTERRKVAQLKEALDEASAELKSESRLVDSLEQDRARKHVIIESEQNKVKALEHARDQLQALLEWEKKNLKSHLQKHEEVESKLMAAQLQLSETTSSLNEKTTAVDVLTQQLESLGELRKEVIRLNSEARQRDFLLASVLKTIGDDKKYAGEQSIKDAKVHVESLRRLIGLDLAGLDDTLLLSGALVAAPRRDLSNYRRIRRTLVWTIPLIPIIAISQDPSILQGITSSLDPQMLQDLTASFAALSSNFDPTMLRDLTRDLTANLGRHIDLSTMQEPIAQMFGMATQMATGVPVRHWCD